MITIRPQAGLGNRLRALDSGVGLAKELNMPLKIEWVRNKDCNCAFFDLFELAENYVVSEKYSSIRDDGKIERTFNPIKRIFYKMTMPSASSIYFNRDMVQMKKKNDFVVDLKSHKNINIQTETSFINNPNPFSYLKPNPYIKQKVDELMENDPNDTIGVHIRRSDNINAISGSPTELFIKRMQDEINNNKDTSFFLATDSIEEEKQLKAQFKNRINTYKKRSYNRNSKEAIQDALIDMLCLSRTKHIIGSYYSSFSEIAAQFGGIELEVIYIARDTKKK